MWQSGGSKRAWHLGLLIFMLLALLGPWVYDEINVPAEYPCEFRLQGDFCGIPLSGLQLFSSIASGLAGIGLRLVSRTTDFAQTIREFLFALLFSLMLLPILSILFLIGRGEQHYRRGFHLAAIFVALSLIIWFLVLGLPVNLNPLWALWGIWLYILMLIGMLVMELFTLVKRRSPAPGEGSD